MPMDPAGLVQGCPWSLCPQLLPAGSGLSSASGFPPVQTRQLCCHRVPQGPTASHSPSSCHQEETSSRPLRHCQTWRPRGGLRAGFLSGVAVHHPGALRAGPSLPMLLSPSSLVPARQPQQCRVGRPGCGCGEVMPHGKRSAQASRAWSFLRARCQPSTPNPGGKKVLDSGYFSPLRQPCGRICLPGGTRQPRRPLPRRRWLRSRLPHGSSAAVPPRL